MLAWSGISRQHVDDPAMLDNNVTVGDHLREFQVLLDQQDGVAAFFQPQDLLADLLDDHRGQASRRLVRAAGKRLAGAQDAGDGQRLLLAAGEHGSHAVLARTEIGELFEQFLVGRASGTPGPAAGRGFRAPTARRRSLAFLGAVGDALAGDLGQVCLPISSAPWKRIDPLRLRTMPMIERSVVRLARPVAADQGDQFAFGAVPSKFMPCRAAEFGVPGVQVLDRQAAGRLLARAHQRLPCRQ